MIELRITPQQIERAKINRKNLPENSNNSIRAGDGTIIGCLGEVVLADYLGVPLCNTYDYDLIYKDQKVEIKTKDRTVPPAPFYNCTVSAANATQKCDFYFFMSLLKDMSKGWLVGYLSRNEFFDKAFYLAEGERDYGKELPAACYNVQIANTRSPVDIRKNQQICSPVFR